MCLKLSHFCVACTPSEDRVVIYKMEALTQHVWEEG